MRSRPLLGTSLLLALFAGCTPPASNPDAALDAVADTVTPPADAPLDAAMTADAVAPRDVVVDVLMPPDGLTATQTEDAARTQRTACTYHRGAWPAETLGRELPTGAQIPIDYVLVIMQENRSFDHYFSQLPVADMATRQTDVEVPSPTWSNPNPSGTPVQRFHDTTYCINDTEHGWDGSHAEWNNGMNDGFVRANQPMGERAMGYMNQDDLPFYYSLASTFALADHYHAALLGPTWPNRLYLMAATSFGLTDNTLVSQDSPDTPVDNIFLQMEHSGRDWRDYADGPRSLAFFSYFGLFRPQTPRHLKTIPNLMADLASGNLAPFSLIEPNYTGPGGSRVDEHPPGTPQAGQAWVERILRAAMASPAWPHMAIFITYDEHGGFADHVAPPAACPPDELTPTDGTHPSTGAFDRYGFRVPMIAVSPYARRHFVSHRTYDHTSIVRFVQARFGLPAMTNRDANAEPPMEMFDFTAAPNLAAPTLAPSRIDPAVTMRCDTAFPSGSAF